MPLDVNYLAEFCTLILEEAGYEVVRVHDYEEAGDMFASRFHEFSLIITNRTLKESDDGDRLIEFVHEILSDFPCILLTGRQSVTLKRKCDLVLYKTFTKDQLLNATVQLIAASEK